MEGRFPLASKEYMQYCLSLNSDYKIGKNDTETKLPVKTAYKNKIPNYIFDKYKIGSTIWSPLASGILTGKYNDSIPENSRFKVKGYEWLADSIENINFDKIKKINILSEELGIKQSQLAILWCLKNSNVSTVILGASKLSQLKENLDSIKYYDLISDDVVEKINNY